MGSKEGLADTNIFKSATISPEIRREGSLKVRELLKEGAEDSKVYGYLYSLSVDELLLVLRDLCIDIPCNAEVKQGIMSLANVKAKLDIIRSEVRDNAY